MNHKKLLAISGSPHTKGMTANMLNCTIKIAEHNGWEVDTINLYEKKIAYCNGCRSCIKTGKCVQTDDIQQIAELLKNCDIVVLASPVYWANIPAVVKNLFDRMLGTAMEETNTFPKSRLSQSQKYILMTSCNTPFPFSWICGQTNGAIHAMKEFFKTSGMTFGGKVICTNTSKKKELSKSLIKKIERYLK